MPSLRSALAVRSSLAVRSALVGGVAADIAEARARARAALAEAEEDAALAQAALVEARSAAAAAEPDLARVRDTHLADLDASYIDRFDVLTRRIAAVTAGIPPAAAAAWPQWTVDVSPHPSRAPQLLRIGTLASAPDIPALVPLLDWGHIAVTGSAAIVAGLLLRAIGSTPPGHVQMSIYDPDGLGASLSGFAPLRGGGGIHFVGPGGLPKLLDDTIAEIRRVNERVLAGTYATLRAHAFATGRRPEPWRIVVLLGTESADDGVRAQLERIVRTGAACGVHLITRGPLAASGAGRVETLSAGKSSSLGAFVPDLAPPAELVTATCRLIADLAAAGPTAGSLRDLLPDKLWMESSAYRLAAPIGAAAGPGGLPVDLALGDNPPHALIGGPSGSGKTNLIYAWLASLTARYSPDELALYLLDFKEGVSFARFAPGRRDPSWLPHVRLVGVNINDDREFGLALLRFLAGELQRRAAAARAHEVTKLSELRMEDPGTAWPRIVAVIDEFQVLLAGRDAVTNEAVALLEDLARRGRSQGIHLILASQDVAGIEALWGRGALVAQFALRIALPKARRILSDINIAAEDIPRFHAIVNAEAGAVDANRTVRLCDAGDREGWDVLQQQMWQMRSPMAQPPRLFDGDAAPRLDLAACMDLATSADPVAIVGSAIDVTPRAATVGFGRTPGRNLAVLGSRRDDACAVLASAAIALSRGLGRRTTGPWADGGASLHVVCFDDDARAHAIAAGGRFYDDCSELLAAMGSDDAAPRFILGYALDAAPATFRSAMRELLHSGPSRGVHVLGWWRSVSRLRDDLGGVAARTDPIGAWVALDVHGPELAAFCPIPGGPTWYPRAHRALFFDRAVHRVPEIVIPYETRAM
jgi:DNA segregation ATPase FtsK/SpoIIIE, S-DNA-T family